MRDGQVNERPHRNAAGLEPTGKVIERQPMLNHVQRDPHHIILRRRQGVSLRLEPEGGSQHCNPLVAIDKAVVSLARCTFIERGFAG